MTVTDNCIILIFLKQLSLKKALVYFFNIRENPQENKISKAVLWKDCASFKAHAYLHQQIVHTYLII